MKSLFYGVLALLLCMSTAHAKTLAHTKGGGNYTLGILLRKPLVSPLFPILVLHTIFPR